MKSAMLALLAMTLGPRSSLAGAPEVTLARTPSWVEEMELPPEQPPPSDVRSGAFYLIVDRQIRVAPGSTERYHRRAWKVLSTAGVQEASEIKVSFDPSYQSLAFHEIRLWRNGRNVRTFTRSDVTVVHEESDLSERIYNGHAGLRLASCLLGHYDRGPMVWPSPLTSRVVPAIAVPGDGSRRPNVTTSLMTPSAWPS